MVYVEMDKPWPLHQPRDRRHRERGLRCEGRLLFVPHLLVRVSRAYRIRVRYQDFKSQWHEGGVGGRLGRSCSSTSSPPGWGARGGPTSRPRSFLSPGGMAPAAWSESPLRATRAAQRSVRFADQRVALAARATPPPHEDRAAVLRAVAVLESHRAPTGSALPRSPRPGSHLPSHRHPAATHRSPGCRATGHLEPGKQQSFHRADMRPSMASRSPRRSMKCSPGNPPVPPSGRHPEPGAGPRPTRA